MARIKSIILQAEINVAGRAHPCQANARHRIKKGDVRLAVRNGRGWDHYCQDCASKIIEQDLAELNLLRRFEIAVANHETQ